jgi:F1F0 ATPase subunit 2
LVLAVVSAGGWLAAGMAIGAMHFLGLRWNVRMLTDGRSPLPALALQLGRFAAIGIVLAVIAYAFGALPLLVATVGILLARSVIIRLGAWP